ncbi:MULTISPECIES: class I SAM-dependent methyltransferase [unclassified Polaromonas]|uniref:class I SAM-dependent methyltransferase n=1 Tax=unclassified Polaromonas TaxID=2638319 RepID=UPI0018C9271B|nr:MULTISPECIES: methyltransferase domain-containing protein [unclassified Polaromonas]MBG6073201.1 ubiquinone/menaquinone biosynthesis C-methylase UbiE [Polaromonas sp. CG_9.7]MBG6115289.1 ubiquinone/menaquinone biosynthesis C-methylase UbiE [Polaromonas sp. CG_9.2]MDH6183515.1 ubiquinone/menaquinone biosynthesis C-methylase UbiE [Polaromonas sp. CG_23.6]
MLPANPEQFKNAVREAWDESASGWNHQTPAIHNWLAAPTAALLGAARIGLGMRVLDVAAGAGDQTLEIAHRVGEGGRVLATDISPAFLQFARENAHQAGLAQVHTRVSDAEDRVLDENGFDAAVCRLGLMLCPNPLRALQQMHRVLRPGGHAAALVFSEPQRNPCLGMLMTTALRHAGLGPRDPFAPGGLLSLGKPRLLEDHFIQAGFAGVTTERIYAPFQLPSARDYLHFVRTSASPILQILGHLNSEAREAAWADMEEQLEVFQLADGNWEGPNELLRIHGMRPVG